MAFAIDTYTGNGSTTNYSITFPYIEQAHVVVTVDGVTKSLTTDYTFSNSSTIAFNSAPASSAVIKFTRSSNRTARLTDYQDGSTLTEATLDQDGNQTFFMAQEAIDITGNNIGLSGTTDQWDANSKRITNVANPVNNNDAVNKTYLENTWLTTANKTALTTVNANIANINAVNSNATNINSAVSNATNINTVATNIGSVNTVATDIAKVITVANDLAEAVSEVETVADDLNETSSEIDTVAGAITNVNNVGNNIANVNTVAGISANVTTVAGNNSNVSTVAGISSDVTAVAGISSDVQAVENIASNVTTVAGISSNVTSVAGVASNVSTLAPIASNITTVAGISANVTAVAGDATDIGTVATDLAGSNNIGTVAGAITNVNNVGGSIANVNTVAGNLSGVNAFGERYRVSANAPTSSLDVGDLWFDSTNSILKVYGATGFQSAGSSVNGTSERFKYTVSGTPTTISGNDDAGNSLSYDAGFIDVYLNGIKMVNGTDVTVTSGSSVVFASALTNGDIVDIVTFGTFNISSMNASNLTSGTVPDARITGTYTGITGLDVNGTVTSTRLSLGDNNKLHLGASNDLEIFHDGSNSIINEAGTGQLVLRTDGTQVSINKGTSENMAKFIVDGAVELYHDNSKKFETTSTGATVTGRLGVGTNNPQNKLDISATTWDDGLLIKNTGNFNTAIIADANRSGAGGGILNLASKWNGTEVAGILFQTGSDTTNKDDGEIVFRTASAGTPQEKMRIDSNGNVAVNNTSPQAKMHIVKTDVGALNDANSNTLMIEHTNAGISIGSATTGEGHIYFSDSGDADVGAMSYFHSDNSLRFRVNAHERMRILSNGRIGINRTAVNGSAMLDISHAGSSEYGLTIDSYQTSGTQYHLDFRRGGSQAGYITSNSATTIAFNNASDERLKENIENSGSALQDIKDLKVRQFDWKDNIDTHRDFGFVAQELHSIIPEAVSVGSDELDDNGKPKQSWGVDYSHIVPRLVKAVQEQQTKIQELEARITTLENN